MYNDAMPELITIHPRFNGPPEAGNGGYLCGLIASVLQRSVSVRLHRAAPLATVLELAPQGTEEWQLRYEGELIATARPASVDVAPPQPPSYLEALAAAQHFAGFRRHMVPRCFVCGPERAQGDGLRIFPGPVEGTDIVAAPWLPDLSLADAEGKVKPEFMWAALDCPGYYASVRDDRPALLGELAVHIDRRPLADEPCVIIGWRIAAEGRKHRVGTALYAKGEALCAVGVATWIELKN